jgi:DNA-binding MarR family transcriptional regulator
MFRYVSAADQNSSATPTEPIGGVPQERELVTSTENPDETAVEVVQNVMRAAHRLRAILNTHFGQFELTDIRYAVLQAIRETASNGCSQKELADHLNQTESSISTLIERMRQSGLLYRLPSTVDRRRKVLLLSELGRETLARAEEIHSRRMASLLTCFNAGEKSALSKLLKAWVEELTRLSAETAKATTPVDGVETESESFSFPFGVQQKPAA